jgi:hypothetical protein
MRVILAGDYRSSIAYNNKNLIEAFLTKQSHTTIAQ